MKKLTERLLVFFIGLPLCLVIVVLLPQKNHLALNILVIVFCYLGAVELSNMLRNKNLSVSRLEAGILGAIIPVGMTLSVSFGVDPLVIPALIVVSAGWLLVSGVFVTVKREAADTKLANTLNHAAAGFAALLYPSSFLSWLILINRLPHSTMLIIAFLCMVFANDSLAWTAGILFGRTNQGIFAVSPNKSIAGFISGLAASVGVGLALASALPHIVFNAARFTPLVSGFVLGLFTGAAAILGDLAESALKRGAGVKDSGTLIPGRGGILDSIDSLALSAPVFYVVYRFLFV
ncbi:MAG: phosphatidate cytidylyltransferase [Spirochaetaceae bacterium]|jgi:phosphatidate cytidylyltransferase|nr:phosphatidate cytidylyltransferase [Spirochaetaceae bacterium]